MKSTLLKAKRFTTATAMLACSIVGVGVATATPVSAASCAGDSGPCIELTPETWDEGYQPGGSTYINFTFVNSGQEATSDATLRVQLPDGASFDTDSPWSHWPNNDSLKYNASTNVVTYQPSGYMDTPGVIMPGEETRVGISFEIADTLSDAEIDFTSSVLYDDESGTAQTPAKGETITYKLSKPYVLTSTTVFSPSKVASGGSSTVTSTITNSGTGTARSIYFYVHVDDRLTIDKTTIPADCDYREQEEWEGQVYPQHLSCDHSPEVGPGESFTISFTVTAPAVSGPEQYEAWTELSCTSSAGASYDDTTDGNSTGLLRLAPPTPGTLAVVQVGGTKPITMPTSSAEPQLPTSGREHSIVSYVYNIGETDIASPVTLVVTIPDGFTPVTIAGTTDDSSASAPVCTLATRTCVFSQLAAGARGRIVLEGMLASSIEDGSLLNVSAQASSSGLSDASDDAKIPVGALSEVRTTVQATGPALANKAVRFAVSAANVGPSVASKPSVKVTLPAGAAFSSVPSGCTAKGTSMTCKWSTLGVDDTKGFVFAATYASGSKASASVALTAASPLAKDSVVKASDSRTLASIPAAVLPATGSTSGTTTAMALMLLACGFALRLVTRRRVL